MVNAVSVKLPTFWTSSTSAWFAQAWHNLLLEVLPKLTQSTTTWFQYWTLLLQHVLYTSSLHLRVPVILRLQCLKVKQSVGIPLAHFPKPQGEWRPCGFYDVTIPDQYPIPHIQDFSSQLFQ